MSTERQRENWRRASRKRYEANREQVIALNNKNQKVRIERNIEFMKKVKSAPCVDCGLSYPPYVMDLDHKRDKTKNVSAMVYSGWSIKRIQDEIDKCDIVCANCHRIRTYSGVE